ncbi:hypothetical protein [Paenibacillus cremeus]|uniref:Uncharacterized protein n=1 Tax=Paenibacillus cremeus TaxID=2163881 RepID=A0A559JHS6_9BACL|nr:hypothetical protein [Paenibacillus cremeus]TVX99432.1 hypothetical protein FPZ49_33715 [Paenibacillus cremeus]
MIYVDKQCEPCREFVVVSLLIENPPIFNEEGLKEVKMQMCIGASDDPVNFIPFFLLAEQALVN